jgi:hypothetical protein
MSEQLRALAERKRRWIVFWLGTLATCVVLVVVLMVMGEPANPSLPSNPGIVAIVAHVLLALMLLLALRRWAVIRGSETLPRASFSRPFLVLIGLLVGVAGMAWYGVYPLTRLNEGVATLSATDWIALAVALLTGIAGLSVQWLLPAPSDFARIARES